MGGQMPIPYMVISQYARDHDIAGNDFRLFHHLMMAIDAEWLDHVANSKSEEGKK